MAVAADKIYFMIYILPMFAFSSKFIVAFTLPPQNNDSDFFDDYNDEFGKQPGFFINSIDEDLTKSQNNNNVSSSSSNNVNETINAGGNLCKEDRCTNSSSQNATHSPLFGFIPRQCPQESSTNTLSTRPCTSDEDCWPRVCCFGGAEQNDVTSTGYCKLEMPIWENLPITRVVSPFRTAMAYWQCTPPPPPDYDLFPKPCRSTFDCFPNLCCQENDTKVCRPPRKSVLTLISNFAQKRASWFG